MATTTTRDKIWTFDDLKKDNTQPPADIIGNGILAPKSFLLIHGMKKARKSILAMNMSMSIASGTGFAGWKVNGAHKVLYLSAEGGYFSNRDRIKKMGTRFNDNEAIGHNFVVCLDCRWKLENLNDLEAIKEQVGTLKPKVLVIDPLIKFHGVDENKAQDMIRVMEILRSLIADHDLAVILVHHEGKESGRGPRGSSVIQGEYDAAIGVAKDGKNCTLSFDLRNADDLQKKELAFDVADFWLKNKDDDPIVKILMEAGRPLDKNAIVHKCVEKKLNTKTSNAYDRITTAMKKGLIFEGKNSLYSLTEGDSPFSILRGE